MSGEGFVLSGGEVFEAGFYGGNCGVGDHQRKGAGFISHHEIKRRLVHYGMWAVIVREFSMGNVFSP